MTTICTLRHHSLPARRVLVPTYNIVLDPLTAIGLAGNIVQFIDFSIKIVGKAHHINNSASGLLPESTDAQMVAQALISLNEKNQSHDSLSKH